MEIVVNGQPRVVPPGFTARQLVADMGLQGKRIAMEINLAIVPRSAYAEQELREGDRIEIVHAVGGG